MTQTDYARAFVRDMAMRALSAEHDADEKWLLAHDALTFERDCDITRAREINIRADLGKPDPLADPRVTALVNLIRQAQGLIDPCYPAKHAAWQNATRAALAAFNTGGKDE